MPTKRRTIDRTQLPNVPQVVVDYLVTGEHVPDLDLFVFLSDDEESARRTWEAVREPVLDWYVSEHPGRRPHGWWVFDAHPTELVEVGEDLEPVPVMRRRRKVEGSGSLTGDPRHGFGIPGFLDMFDPPRPDALPVYESQAAYLRRHGLLSKAEARRLRKKDYDPEIVEVDPEELAEIWEFLEQHAPAANPPAGGLS